MAGSKSFRGVGGNRRVFLLLACLGLTLQASAIVAEEPPARPRPVTAPIAPPVLRPTVPGAVATGLFGVQATGSRFVYLLDCSSSMADHGGIALEAARDEVCSSLEHLRKGSEFAILFYSGSVERHPSGPEAGGFAPFSVDAVRRAKDRVARVRVNGTADHALALERALLMNPDVAFLVTDSHQRDDLTAEELDHLLRIRGSTRCMVIHLGNAAAQRCPNLAVLAGKSGGRYEAFTYDGEGWRTERGAGGELAPAGLGAGRR